jgi:hypothetical protein
MDSISVRDRVGVSSPLCADTVAKVENRTAPKISQKLTFRQTGPLQYSVPEKTFSTLSATTGRSRKDAIDPERPSTVSKLIKLMRRTYHRTIHWLWRSLAFLIVSALRMHLLNLPPGDGSSHADFSHATFSKPCRRRLAFIFILQSTNRARSRQSDCPRRSFEF